MAAFLAVTSAPAQQAPIVPEVALRSVSMPEQPVIEGSLFPKVSTGLVAVSVAALVGSRRITSTKQKRTARRAEPKGPLAVPMLPEPAYRTYGDTFLGEADAGFDPLSFSSTASPFGDGKAAYWNYREAEVKHGRLAMLATLGWLAAETVEPGLAKNFGVPDLLAKGELAPSVLNGGLGSLPPFFLPLILAVSAFIELAPNRKDKRAEDGISYTPQFGRMPGDYGFDPLGFGTSEQMADMGKDIRFMHNAEVKHGRAAMIAISAFVLQEDILRIPILRQDEEVLDKSVSLVDAVTGLNIPVPFPGA